MTDKLELHLARFVEWMKIRGWSYRTIESYESCVRFFFDYLKKEASVYRLQDVQTRTVHSYQNFLYHEKKKGKRLALSTQNTRLVAVRSFFRFLVDTDVLLFDPSSNLKLPKKKRHLPRGVMTEEQVELLLAQPNLATPLGFRDRTIMELLYSTAIRNAELRKLSIYDVDTKEMRLTVREGKNSKDRVVPIGEIACDYLKEYLQSIRQKLCRDQEQTLLFVSKNGKQITSANLITAIEKYVKKADLPKEITPHSFRHSCATHMLKRGADIRYIQQMLGHASVATTQIYTKVEAHDLKAVHRQCHPREQFDES